MPYQIDKKTGFRKKFLFKCVIRPDPSGVPLKVQSRVCCSARSGVSPWQRQQPQRRWYGWATRLVLVCRHLRLYHPCHPCHSTLVVVLLQKTARSCAHTGNCGKATDKDRRQCTQWVRLNSPWCIRCIYITQLPINYMYAHVLIRRPYLNKFIILAVIS